MHRDFLLTLCDDYLDKKDYRKAWEICHLVLDKEPNNLRAFYNLGIISILSGKPAQALPYLKKVIRGSTPQPGAYLNLGIALQSLGNLSDAARHLKKAAKLCPAEPDPLIYLGNVNKELGKLEEAERNYKKALELDKENSIAHINLGNIYRELGTFDKALKCYRSAIKANPNFGDAYRNIAAIKKTTSRQDDDFIAMEQAYQRSGQESVDRMYLAFGLGKSCEELGDFEKAFEYYLDGNRLKWNSVNYSNKATKSLFEAIRTNFTKKFIERFEGKGSPSESPIFIVGMPRSGTTLTEQILASHPLVYGAGEIVFMANLLGDPLREIANSGIEQFINKNGADLLPRLGAKYIKQTRAISSGAQFVTDKLPENFAVLGLIRIMLPNAKIVHCRRSPEDTCLSIFKNLFVDEGMGYSYSLKELGQYYNLYSEMMRHWHSIFPDKIFDLDYEDLVSDTERHSKRLLEFCGLEWDDKCLTFYENSSRVATASAVQVREPAHKKSVELWRKYERWLKPLLEEIHP